VLRDLEDSEEGMPFQRTHDHVAPIDVGGVTLARVVELINGYTVTFEDGQYAVNIVGGNSNIGDNVNVNQVSIRSANSAGLISNAQIEFASFNGGVWIDVTSEYSGTVFPRGTPQAPVNNLADAKLIASVRGFERLYIIGNITLTSTDNVDDFIIEGQSHIKTKITIEAGASTTNTEFENAQICGVLDGNASIDNCMVCDLTYVEGNIYNSILTGTVTLAGSIPTRIIGCSDGDPDGNTPTFNMNGSGRDLVVAQYSGDIKIMNLTAPQYVSIDLNSGVVWLDSTVTAGFIYLRGVGSVYDNSTNTTIYNRELVNVESVANQVWDEQLSAHLTSGSTGEALNEGGVDAASIEAIADAVWDELLSEHGISGSAGESLYIAGKMAPEGGWMSSSTASEIKLVRDKLGDAGNLVAETIIDEEGIASTDTTVFTMYQMIYEVNGVWLKSDTGHTGTNYYVGDNGTFDAHTGMITLHTALPTDNEEVIISYTYFKGLHDDVISQFLTEAKMFIKKYTRKTYDWTLAFADPPDEETQIATWAAASLAAKRCLEALASGDILQLGFNFRLGDLEIENMVRGGGFQVQAHIDMLNEDVNRKLSMLGRGMYFSTASTTSYGRDYWGYCRSGTANRRSDIQ